MDLPLPCQCVTGEIHRGLLTSLASAQVSLTLGVGGKSCPAEIQGKSRERKHAVIKDVKSHQPADSLGTAYAEMRAHDLCAIMRTFS